MVKLGGRGDDKQRYVQPTSSSCSQLPKNQNSFRPLSGVAPATETDLTEDLGVGVTAFWRLDRSGPVSWYCVSLGMADAAADGEHFCLRDAGCSRGLLTASWLPGLRSRWRTPADQFQFTHLDYAKWTLYVGNPSCREPARGHCWGCPAPGRSTSAATARCGSLLPTRGFC